jgi:hypothetical protein
LNAKIGKEDEYTTITGVKSKHEGSDENGKVIEFAEESNMKIKSTTFQHKDIHKETWISPDGKTGNQIDHLLMENRLHRNIKDVPTKFQSGAKTDHMLVVESRTTKGEDGKWCKSNG